MKIKKVLFLGVFAILSSSLIGCNQTSGGSTKTHNVTFNLNYLSGTNHVISVEDQNLVPKDKIPSVDGGNLYFTHWYQEKECINEFNFDTTKITNDITLYAGWYSNSIEAIVDEFSCYDYLASQDLFNNTKINGYYYYDTEKKTLNNENFYVSMFNVESHTVEVNIKNELNIGVAYQSSSFHSLILLYEAFAKEGSFNISATYSMSDLSKTKPVTDIKISFNDINSNKLYNYSYTFNANGYLNKYQLLKGGEGLCELDFSNYEKSDSIVNVVYVSLLNGLEIIDTQRVKKGSAIGELSNKTLDGYTLDGWYKNPSCKEVDKVYPTDVINSSLTCYACWSSQNQYDFLNRYAKAISQKDIKVFNAALINGVMQIYDQEEIDISNSYFAGYTYSQDHFIYFDLNNSQFQVPARLEASSMADYINNIIDRESIHFYYTNPDPYSNPYIHISYTTLSEDYKDVEDDLTFDSDGYLVEFTRTSIDEVNTTFISFNVNNYFNNNVDKIYYSFDLNYEKDTGNYQPIQTKSYSYGAEVNFDELKPDVQPGKTPFTSVKSWYLDKDCTIAYGTRYAGSTIDGRDESHPITLYAGYTIETKADFIGTYVKHFNDKDKPEHYVFGKDYNYVYVSYEDKEYYPMGIAKPLSIKTSVDSGGHKVIKGKIFEDDRYPHEETFYLGFDVTTLYNYLSSIEEIFGEEKVFTASIYGTYSDPNLEFSYSENISDLFNLHMFSVKFNNCGLVTTFVDFTSLFGIVNILGNFDSYKNETGNVNLLFDTNDGTHTLISKEIKFSEGVENFPKGDELTRENYSFVCWCFDQNCAEGTEVSEDYVVHESRTFYARWKFAGDNETILTMLENKLSPFDDVINSSTFNKVEGKYDVYSSTPPISGGLSANITYDKSEETPELSSAKFSYDKFPIEENYVGICSGKYRTFLSSLQDATIAVIEGRSDAGETNLPLYYIRFYSDSYFEEFDIDIEGWIAGYKIDKISSEKEEISYSYTITKKETV